MAVKGSISKSEITTKILEFFPNSFAYDKEIRIPMIENGEEVQIKVTLTAAKTNVEHYGDAAPIAAKTLAIEKNTTIAQEATPLEPTEEEKENIRKLMASLF